MASIFDDRSSDVKYFTVWAFFVTFLWLLIGGQLLPNYCGDDDDGGLFVKRDGHVYLSYPVI